jgi:hypothetical protein
MTEVLRQLPKEIRQLIAISLAHEELGHDR